MKAVDIKATLRRIVDKIGNSKAAATICGARDCELSWWKLDHHDRHIPIDHLIRLDAAAGDIFLKEWAQARGYELTSVSRSAERAALCVIKSVGHLSKEAGELGFTVLEAAADSEITLAEKRRIRDDIAPVKEALAELERAIA